MYCPKCGIQIGDIGNYCGRCGKDVAYLRERVAASVEEEIIPEEEMLSDDEALMLVKSIVKEAGEEVASGKSPEKPVEKKTILFYCNYSGAEVFPEDNYCYDCGKPLQKSFYNRTDGKNTKKAKAIKVGLVILFVAVLAASYIFFSGLGHH